MPSRSEMVEELKDLKEAIELFDERLFGESHPAYVAVQKEVDVLQKRLAGDVDLRTKAMLNSHYGDGVAFPASTRNEMAEHIAGHSTYHDGGRTYLSWNIKLHQLVEAATDEYDFDPSVDERWEELMVSDNSVFDEALENVLRRYIDGDYVAAADTSGRKASFSTVGRSGGHLVLTRLELPDGRGGRRSTDVSFGTETDLRGWIFEEMEDDELVALYNVVCSVDADVRDRAAIVASELAYLRSLREEEWASTTADDQEESAGASP